MGYESKFYAVKKYSISSRIKGYNASEIIAFIDVCKMGYEKPIKDFLNLFNEKIDFALYLPGYDEKNECEHLVDTITDSYGDHICYISDIEKGIKLLNQIIKKSDYKRFVYLKKFLEMFKDSDDVYICHYGY